MCEAVPVGKTKSLYSFIGKYCEDENATIHRLCSLMRLMNVQSVIVEPLIKNLSSINELSEESKALKTRNCEITSIFRLTFSSKELSTPDEIIGADDSILSSAYIINFRDLSDGSEQAYLYKAIVAEPAILEYPNFGPVPQVNNYLHIRKNFKCTVGISSEKFHNYELTGTFFCQQNEITSVCAHAALCMIINNLDKDIFGLDSDLEVTAVEINQILIDKGLPFEEEREPLGLKPKQFRAVLDFYGLDYVDNDYDYMGGKLGKWFKYHYQQIRRIEGEHQRPRNRLFENLEYNDWIYNFIESKYPVLLGFEARNVRHIVSVVGHTLNPGSWKPEAEKKYSTKNRFDSYTPSSSWVDNLIIHDDNFGMYLHLSVDALRKITKRRKDQSFKATYVLALVPKDVVVPFKIEAEQASLLVAPYLIFDHLEMNWGETDIWSKRLLSCLINNSMEIDDRVWVIRTLLTTKVNYLSNLEQKNFNDEFFNETDKKLIGANLPDKFWLSEITLPDLYTANKAKIIDVFYPCDLPAAAPDDYDQMFPRWIQARFPNRLVVRDEVNNISSDLSVGGHFPLLNIIT